MKNIPLLLFSATLLIVSCKKKGCTDETALNYSENAKEDDGTCIYDPAVLIPETYSFTDADGNNTVSYSGQIERLNQLAEMSTYTKGATAYAIDREVLKDMFENTGDNGGGNFSFSSSKQLKDKCFPSAVATFEAFFDSITVASESYDMTAAPGQAGTLSTGTSTYLFAANGMEYAQLLEKGLMGAVSMYQATQVYFGDDKMSADNSVAVDAAAGKYYTQLEHHWDEAFGYFGAPIDFPTNTEGLTFWAKYSNSSDLQLNSNAAMMNAFKEGRALITAKSSLDVVAPKIEAIRRTWERIAAAQAIAYLEGAKANFGTDNAMYLHQLSEAYAFVMTLKYVSLETRVVEYAQIINILEDNIGDNLWDVTVADLNVSIDKLTSFYAL
jgi:hypothetical protein